MKDVFIAAWDLFEEYCKKQNLILNNEKEEFVEECCDLYRNFSYKHMRQNQYSQKKSQKNDDKIILDRHKIAAIIAIIGSAPRYIQPKSEIKDDKMFFGRYTIPLVTGISLVQQLMNEDLIELGFTDKNDWLDLYIPMPAVCKTKYIDSLARNMYYEEEYRVEANMRVIQLANVFFLMEECTLLKNEIDLDKWVELKRNNLV